jgi:chorismate mutase/prephenate dehydratase
MKTTQTIETLRADIDRIDEQLLDLLSRRMIAASRIGEIKRRDHRAVVDTLREQIVLQRLAARNQGPLPTPVLHHIFAEIITACREIQGPAAIAYLGPEGTFTHTAAIRHFGHTARLTPCFQISDVFAEVDKGNAHYGVVPVENSIEGSVNPTLDLFLETPVRICGEIYLNISHDLLSLTGDPGRIRVIVSHPQAYAQCRRWLETHLPEVVFEPCQSTAAAAQMAGSHAEYAAIAGSEAGSLYDLKPIATRIEDSARNTTRFWVIGQSFPGPSENDKTTLLFSTLHTPGSLYHALKPLNDARINMVKLESRPARHANWNYVFFVDIEGHLHNPAVRRAVDEMKPLCMALQCLGSYPRAETVF